MALVGSYGRSEKNYVKQFFFFSSFNSVFNESFSLILQQYLCFSLMLPLFLSLQFIPIVGRKMTFNQCVSWFCRRWFLLLSFCWPDSLFVRLKLGIKNILSREIEALPGNRSLLYSYSRTSTREDPYQHRYVRNYYLQKKFEMLCFLRSYLNV